MMLPHQIMVQSSPPPCIYRQLAPQKLQQAVTESLVHQWDAFTADNRADVQLSKWQLNVGSKPVTWVIF